MAYDVQVFATDPAFSTATATPIFNLSDTTFKTEFGDELTHHLDIPAGVGRYHTLTTKGGPAPAQMTAIGAKHKLSSTSMDYSKVLSTLYFTNGQQINAIDVRRNIKSKLDLVKNAVADNRESMRLQVENQWNGIQIFSMDGRTMPTSLGYVDALCGDSLKLFQPASAPHTFQSTSASNYNMPAVTVQPSCDGLVDMDALVRNFVDDQGNKAQFEIVEVLCANDIFIKWNVQLKTTIGNPNNANRADNPVKHMKKMSDTPRNIPQFPNGQTNFRTSATDMASSKIFYKLTRVTEGGLSQDHIWDQDTKTHLYVVDCHISIACPIRAEGWATNIGRA